jgi:hypothetical protein
MIFGFFVCDFARSALCVVLRGPTSISTGALGARDEEASLPGPCARFDSRMDRSTGFPARTMAIRGCSCLVRFAAGVLLPSCMCNLGSCHESPVLFLASLPKPRSASCLPPVELIPTFGLRRCQIFGPAVLRCCLICATDLWFWVGQLCGIRCR